MKKPVFRKISEWKDKGAGYVIFDEEAEIIAANVVTVKQGATTSEGNHPDEEEVYLVQSGKGRVRVGDIVQDVGKGTVIYIPRNAPHQATGLSKADFVYVCVAIYFDRKPDAQ
jgi:quercetin dioxygenase-like cupin family protein